MTLAQIQADVYRKLNFEPSPDSRVVARILAYINEVQREIVGLRGMERLRRATLPMVTVADTPFAVLPQAAVAILGITDRTNGVELTEMTAANLRNEDPGLNSSASNPYGYVIDNLAAPVARDPSNASELFLLSDAAETPTAYVEGVLSNGGYKVASRAMTGVTGLSLGATITTWLHITKFYLSAAAVGNVTLLEDSAVGTELARIPVGRQFARYSRLRLHPVPSAVTTLYVEVELRIEDMANAGDEPYLPEDFHWLLSDGAIMREYEKREKQGSYKIIESRYRRGISDMRSFVNRISGPQDRRPRKFSQLGPFYPAGS